MNTELMLKVADEIEARPDLYDQHVGMASHGTKDEECRICVAGNVIRTAGARLEGLAWADVSERAQALLGLNGEEALELFAASPEAEDLHLQFPWVSEQELDALDGLTGWILDDEAMLCPVDPIDGVEELEKISFTQFWGQPVRERHVLKWRRASARVIAATLRLTAAGAGGRENAVVGAEGA